MDDTQRLDAIGNYGLCVVRHDDLVGGRWLSRWTCNYGVGVQVEAPTMRQAIDLAVADIERHGADCH